MNSETIVMCVVALILGMLLAHMLKSVVEGAHHCEGVTIGSECDMNNCSATALSLLGLKYCPKLAYNYN